MSSYRLQRRRWGGSFRIMNILSCDPLKLRSIGSWSVHSYEVLSGLSKMGHNVVLINGKQFRNIETDANLQLLLWTRIKTNLSRSQILQPLRGEITILRHFLQEVRVFLSTFIIIVSRRGRVDIIYRRHTAFNSEYLLAKLFKIPSVKEVNGIAIDEAKIAKQGDRISLRIIDKIERFNMPKADRIIVVTSKLKEVLQKGYDVPEDKIVVIPNGANTDLFKPMDAIEAREKLGLNRSDNYICFAGNLVQWQGVEYLMKSAPLVLEKCPGTRFLIVGDGPMKQELIELAHQIGVSNRVIFVGMVPYQEVPLHMNASDICVLPKKLMGMGYSPLKLCEYMACMKPVVATRTDDFEILEEFNTGVLIDPENRVEFANAIIKLIQTPELRGQMGENGRKYVVENRSWESVAKKVEEICSEVAGERA